MAGRFIEALERQRPECRDDRAGGRQVALAPARVLVPWTRDTPGPDPGHIRSAQPPRGREPIGCKTGPIGSRTTSSPKGIYRLLVASASGLFTGYTNAEKLPSARS